MKIIKFSGLLGIILICIEVMWTFESSFSTVITNIACLVIGFILPKLYNSTQDFLDTTEWKISQRKIRKNLCI